MAENHIFCWCLRGFWGAWFYLSEITDMGIIFDKIKGREYALSVADFNRFMETGDLSLLPKGSSCSSKVRKPRLIELSLMQPEQGS
jgi:hypothetical protein